MLMLAFVLTSYMRVLKVVALLHLLGWRVPRISLIISLRTCSVQRGVLRDDATCCDGVHFQHRTNHRHRSDCVVLAWLVAAVPNTVHVCTQPCTTN